MPPLRRSLRCQSTVTVPNRNSFHASTTTPVPVVHSSSPQYHRALSGLLVGPYTSTRRTRKSLRLFFAQSPPRLYFTQRFWKVFGICKEMRRRTQVASCYDMGRSNESSNRI